MLSDNPNLAPPCLSLKCENRRHTGNGNGNGNGNFAVAHSDHSIPADNSPTPGGEYGGAEAAGNLARLDPVSAVARILRTYHGLEAARFHDKPVASVMLSQPCSLLEIVTGAGASCLTILSGGLKLERLHLTNEFKGSVQSGGGGRYLSANNAEDLGECTVSLTRGQSAAAATVVWKRRVPGLTYRFEDNFPDVSKQAVLRAFESWEEPLNFTFSWSPGKADIVIGMYSGDHGDCQPFKVGPGGVLAHATLPPHGDIHFNADQPWWFDPVPPPKDEQVYDFQSVAAHEIGHNLGIEHIDDPKAVMHGFIELGETKRGLTNVDVAALKHLYKGDPNFD